MLGESGDIFFPKLEESQMEFFKDITDRFIEEIGYQVDLCNSETEAKEKAVALKQESNVYPVYYFKTNTSGEKLFEEFYAEKDVVQLDNFHSLGVIKNSIKRDREDIDKMINELKGSMSSGNVSKAKIVEMISKFIPDFAHIETGVGLDQKM